MVNESMPNRQDAPRRTLETYGDLLDSESGSLHARRTLRQKERLLAASRNTITRLQAEASELQVRKNALAGQVSKLQLELEQTISEKAIQHSAKVQLEAELVVDRVQLAEYKSAFERLESNSLLRFSRVLAAPVKKLARQLPTEPEVTPAPNNEEFPQSAKTVELESDSPRLIIKKVSDTYRIEGNVSLAEEITQSLPPKYAPTDSERILLDQVHGEARLLKGLPSVPRAQRGIGYIAHADRIMYCTQSPAEFENDGSSRRTRGLTKAIADLGTDIFIAARPGYPWDTESQEQVPSATRFEDRPNGVRTVCNPGPSWTQNALDYYFHEAADVYAREAMINRPSKIVAVSDYIVALPALIAARRLGVPFACEVRELLDSRHPAVKDLQPDSERYTLSVSLETMVVLNADYVFAINETIKNELVKRGVPQNRITLLPTAVDIFEFAPLRPNPTYAESFRIKGGLTLGYAGDLNEHRGLDMAIRAIADLVHKDEPVKLVIVGDGHALTDLASLTTELGIEHAVEFVGKVSPLEVPRFLEAFDAVVFPQRRSSCIGTVGAHSPLEAMSSGKAIIASDIAPHAELFGTDGSRGALFEADDVLALAKVIRDLTINRAKCEEMGREARRWITKYRSWSAIAQRQLEGLRKTTETPVPSATKRLGDMTIALISDEFTRKSIYGDVNIVLPTPSDWKTVIAESNIDLLFVESAWEGNNGSWTRKVGYYNEEQCRELRSLIIHCRSKGIPTVFWNKEDPIHFNRFRKTAKYFDHVLSTDANCLKDYWHNRGSLLQTLTSLPFWAQPKIHNPLPSGEVLKHTVAYGGSYYGKRFSKRSKELVSILDAAIQHGLTIYDRQFDNADSPYVFPKHLLQYVQGGLAYDAMVKAYKIHPVHINVNSVSNSPTMFSRRVFELAACGTPVISGPGLEIGGLFDSAIPSNMTPNALKASLDTWMSDETARVDAAWAALRVVYRSHLSAHRLAYVMRIAGLDVEVDELPAYVLEVDVLSDQSVHDILHQTHRPKVVIAKNDSSPEHVKNLTGRGIEVVESMPIGPAVAVANLGSSLVDPFAAEDLATALLYSGSTTASIKIDCHAENRVPIWQFAPVGPGNATMDFRLSSVAKNVSLHKVPANAQTVPTKHHKLYPAADEPLVVLLAGHDLKFTTEIQAEIEDLGHTVLVDKWKGHSKHDESQSRELLEQSDVIFCEWSLGNLSWYSKQKLPGQRLVARFHSQELFTDFPTNVDFDEVDKIVFVGEFIRQVALRRFGIPETKTTVIPNYVDLPALNLAKIEEARFNLGIVGIVPKQKRLDLALDLLSSLRVNDSRYKLFIKGRKPEAYRWMAARPDEMEFFDSQYARIENDPILRGAVIFDDHGNDMDEWYRKIGVVLSVSDFESFHFTLADGAASCAVPVSLTWPGAELIYPQSWLLTSICAMSARILAITRSDEEYTGAGEEAQQIAQRIFSRDKSLVSLVNTITRVQLP